MSTILIRSEYHSSICNASSSSFKFEIIGRDDRFPLKGQTIRINR